MTLEEQFWNPNMEEQLAPTVPKIALFREAVDKIPDVRDSIVIKTLYLLGARVSEIVTKTTPYQLKNRKSKPYGRLLTWSLQDYDFEKKKEKLLLLKSAVAKRSKKQKNDSSEQKKQIIRFKIIPLPTNPKYENWTVDILKWIQKQKDHKLGFPITGMTVQNIVKKHLRILDKRIFPHKVRHWRITHLITEYNFSPYEITSYAGWSFSSTFGAMGIKASSNLDIYAHLQWRDYVNKLFKPLEDIMS